MPWGWLPGKSRLTVKTAVFYKLEQLTGVRREIIRNNYQNYAPGNYVPVGEASAEAVNASGYHKLQRRKGQSLHLPFL